MADKTVNIELRVKTAGMDQAEKQSAAIANNLAKANKAGTASPAAARPGAAAINSSMVPGESKTARSLGAGAGTGSAASDFAAQASGLGGLVHVYATFAANVFAVSAAFNALSKAMDVTNLVKGLDQIGAASGRNLGSVAKQMVAAADGAISLQQAMTSTAMASSGGMTNQAIIRMTEVAKKASLALGRDMPDSMDRLTKGIIKTQPELLDELGIMTRMIPAQQEYARQIGKTIGSLTDFEKRQAFANAVLAEGEKKFGSINLDANPYSKILASMQNLMQTGLEMMNKVLGPIMSMLSQSPTGLALAMGGLATLLLKQAIPALGMFRENARRMSEETTARVKRQVEEQSSAASQMDVLAAKRAEKEYLTVGAGLKEVEKLRKASFNSTVLGYEVRGLLKKSPLDLTKEEADKILAKHKELEDKITTGTASKKDSDQYKKLEDRASRVIELQKKVSKVGDLAADANEKRDSTWWSHQQQKEKYLAKLEIAATKSQILSGVSDTAATMGPSIAYQKLKEDLKDLKDKGISTLGTQIRGTFAIATSAVGTAINAFGMWGQAIALVGVAFGVLDNWISKSAKEASAYSTSINTIESSFSNVERTLEVLSKKDSDFLSAESTQAKANALNDLTTNLSDTYTKFIKLKEAQNVWDSMFDGLWSLIGKGASDKLSMVTSKSVINSLKLLETGPIKNKATAAIKELFGQNVEVDLTSFDSFNASLKGLDSTLRNSIIERLPKILEEASREANNSASALTGFNLALADIGKQMTVMSNALIPTDNFSKLGMEAQKASSTMEEVFKDPIHSLEAIYKLSGDHKSLALLNKTDRENLVKDNEVLKVSTDTIGKLEQARTRAAEELAKQEAIQKDAKDSAGSTTAKEDAAYFAAVEVSKVVEARLKQEKEAADKIVDKYKQLPNEFAAKSFELLSKGLSASLAEASITAAKGFQSVLKQAGGDTAVRDSALEQQSFQIQADIVRSNYSLAKIQQELILVEKESNLLREKDLLSKEYGNSPDKESVSNKLILNEKQLTAVKRQSAMLQGDSGTREVIAAAKLKDTSKISDTLKQDIKDMSGWVYAAMGMEASLAKIRANAQAAELSGRVAIAVENINNIKRSAASDISREQDALKLLDIQKQSSEYYNDELQTTIHTKQETLSLLESNQKRLAIITKLATANIAINASSGDNKTKALNAQAKVIKELDDFDNKRDTDKAERDAKNLLLVLKGRETIAKFTRENTALELKEENNLKLAKLSTQESNIKYLQTIGVLTSSEYVAKQASLDLDKQDISYNMEKNAILEKGISDLANLRIAKQVAQSLGGKGDMEQIAIDNYIASQQRQLNTLYIYNAAKVSSIQLESQHTILIESQAEAMAKMVTITESLTNLFGEMGSNIGKAGEAILKMAQTDEVYIKNRMAAKDELSLAKSDRDPKAEKAASDKIVALDKKASKDKLTNIGLVAGATKKMFAEHTGAYKLLDGIEKASHIMRIVDMAKELGTLLSSVATSIAAMFTKEAATSAAKVPNVLMSFVEWLGPWGVGAGAAFLASIGLSSGGAAVSTAGLTAADMQKSQGTGQSWVDGKLVDNGGGVYGDSTAKTKSITDSLEVLNATSIEGISLYNAQINILEKINTGIQNVAKGLYDTKGMRSGSISGTLETSTSNPGFLGLFASSSSTSIINSGIELVGTFLDLATAGKGVVRTFEVVQNTSTRSGFFGIGGGTSTSLSTNYGDLSKTVIEDVSSIFSGARDLFIDQADTVLKMSPEMVDTILSKVDVHALASLRGLSGQALQDEFSSVVGGILDDAAAEIFPKLKKYRQFGEGFSTTVTRVIDGFSKVNDAFKSIGKGAINLTEVGSKATQEMYDAVTRDKANLAAAKLAVPKSIFETITRSRGSGADTSETVLSNAKDIEKANKLVADSQRKLADSTAVLTEANSGMTTRNYDATERLINLAGGLDKFLESAAFFADNFLSDFEKAVPKQAALSTELLRISTSSDLAKNSFAGITDIVGMNREIFKGLVLSIDTTTESGASLYDALMKVAPAFDEVAKITDKYFEAFATPAEKLSKKVTKLKSGLLTLQDIGRNEPVAGPALTVYETAMKNAGLTSLKSAADYDTLVKSLDGVTGNSKKLRDGLVALGPAFAEVYKEVAGIVKAVTDNIDSSIFNMEYGMKSDAGKYAMLDQQAADSNALMLAAGDKNNIYEVADYANKTIDSVNKAWSLLSAEQQSASFSEYKATLEKIANFVKDEGADPLSLQNARDKATADTIATQVAAAVKEALAQSAADIKTAAENINAAADKPNIANVNMNVAVSNPTKSEVSITTWNDQ